MAVRGGNKPKAPGRGAVPLKANAKDLRIAQLEAQLRRMNKVPVQVSKAKKQCLDLPETPPPEFTAAARVAGYHNRGAVFRNGGIVPYTLCTGVAVLPESEDRLSWSPWGHTRRLRGKSSRPVAPLQAQVALSH